MTTRLHREGPWYIEDRTYTIPHHVIGNKNCDGPGIEFISVCTETAIAGQGVGLVAITPAHAGHSYEMCLATAVLIASAPQMFATLRDLCEQIGDLDTPAASEARELVAMLSDPNMLPCHVKTQSHDEVFELERS